MSTDRDTKRILRSWLEEGATALPDRVLDAVLDELPATHQRRATWWRARRFPHMNHATRVALASAAVVAVALIGFNVFSGQNVGGPDIGDPTLTPEPTRPPALIRDGELDAGAYAVTVSGIQVTLTVPDGWTGFGGFAVVKSPGEPSEADLGFFLVDQAYLHPCQWDGALPDLHPGYEVEDLADGLANQALRGDSVPTDVTVDGYNGKLVELTVPPDVDFAECDEAEFRSWPGRYHQGPGQHDSVYILDVNGARLVIDAAYLPGTSNADRAELQAILDSIQIDP